MSAVFIVAAGRSLGAGIFTRLPGAIVPISGDTVQMSPHAGPTQLSRHEAEELERGGFGRIKDDPGASPGATPIAGGE